MNAKGKGYSRWLREDMSTMIDLVQLSDLQKHYLRSRWLEQVVWMEDKAQDCRNRYHMLRLTTIIGGLIVPALVGLNAVTGIVGDVVYWMIFFISLMVSITAGLDEFFKYGDRWRHYRSIVEELKIIGWQYFQLAGRFKDFKSHHVGYISFVNTIEDIMQKEVEVFVSNVTKEKQRKNEEEEHLVLPQEEKVTPLYPKAAGS